MTIDSPGAQSEQDLDRGANGGSACDRQFALRSLAALAGNSTLDRKPVAQGARINTFTWLGTTRAPGQLVEFCSDMLVKRVAGMPPTSVVNEAVK